MDFRDFRAIQETDKTALNKTAAAFIDSGSMSTTIHINNEDLVVGFVYSANPATPDTAHLYTHFEKPQTIGTTFSWLYGGTNRYYLIIDEIPSVKKVLYHEYNVYECNVLAGTYHGYLINTAQKYIDTKLQSNVMEISLAKPLLILGTDSLAIGDIIRLANLNSADENRVWRILEKDNYSTQGLVYYSLESYVAREQPNDSTLIPEDVVEYDDEVRAGAELTLTTEDGYFESDINLKKVITPTKIYVTIPYTASYINFRLKTNGEIISTKYKVVK